VVGGKRPRALSRRQRSKNYIAENHATGSRNTPHQLVRGTPKGVPAASRLGQLVPGCGKEATAAGQGLRRLLGTAGAGLGAPRQQLPAGRHQKLAGTRQCSQLPCGAAVFLQEEESRFQEEEIGGFCLLGETIGGDG